MHPSTSRAIASGVLGLLLTSAGAVAQGASAPAGAAPGAWSPPVLVASDAPELAGVSCSSDTACWAIGPSGTAYRYDGSAWTGPATIDIYNTNAISCPVGDFCMVTSLQGSATHWDGTAWSTPDKLDMPGFLGSSCSSASFCGAVKDDGRVFLWDGRGWDAGTPVDQAAQDAVDAVNAGTSYDTLETMIDCPADGVCMVLDGLGDTFVLGDGKWVATAPTGLPGGSKATTLSCASPTFCVVAGTGEGAVTIWDGSAWSPQPAAPAIANLDCVSATFCMAVPDYWYVYDGTRWLSSTYDVPSPPQVFGLDCVTETWCVAVDARGDASIYSR